MDLVNGLTPEAKTATVKLTATREEVAAAPFAYANHVEVRATADEVFLTFYVRQDYAAVIVDGVMESHVKPVITLVVAPEVASRIIAAVGTVIPPKIGVPDAVETP